MSFDIYIEEMKRLGWKEEDLKKDYELHEKEIKSGQEFPWFPTPLSDLEDMYKPEGDIKFR